ncbi:BTAD domain-containing putative transcriptional regulator [Nocardioides halotolerans]|uniref:BTAD domain-containing putative transcriptional regulator n=1 Tax=Nocardioides halotolerans TaxID=433660 RepID=UPI0004051154|nr:BTAD domain-containing putative transcriptional regulator [Nocardioides halotolerans]
MNASAGLSIHLLGRPSIEIDGDVGYRFRSRKSWALLALLLLSERPPTRSALASLLFSEADDPLGALRWSLAEVRRGLGPSAVLDGDPVQVQLPPGTSVDVDVLVHGHWNDAVKLPGLGLELLDGLSLAHAEPFEAWLLSQRRRLSAATESIVHEAALGLLARGEIDRARDLAVRATLMSPLDENHQALLIRIYRLAGDTDAAERQFRAWTTTAERELGTSPGAAVLLALREPPATAQVVDVAAIDAVAEGGAAAVSAGAVVAGVASFEAAVRMADQAEVDSARVETRLVLAEALIHAWGGLDEAGLARLTEAERIAIAMGDLAAVARARAELGYVDFLRARYDRAERLLDQVLTAGDAAPSTRAKAMTYLGSVASDQADYPRATTLLEGAIRASRAVGEPRREAYGLSMLGRIGLLRGDLDAAVEHLTAAIGVAGDEHWLSFLPWPQALLGDVLLARGDIDGAAGCLAQSFARACQIGDPCWEGISARGLALLSEARGEPDRAVDQLLDARSRANRLTDPYVWLDVHILDALCGMGVRHGHPSTAAWVEEMRERASRTGMRELTVRAMLHGARLGHAADAEAAVLLAGAIDNPVLVPMLAGSS